MAGAGGVQRRADPTDRDGRRPALFALREATLEAKQIVRSDLQMLEALDPNQESDLEILGELAQTGSVHCVAPLKAETCTYINEQTKLKLALNMAFSVEPSLLLELLK